jgi:hypothetical protein
MEKRPVDQIIPGRMPLHRRGIDEGETDNDRLEGSDYFGHGWFPLFAP